MVVGGHYHFVELGQVLLKIWHTLKLLLDAFQGWLLGSACILDLQFRSSLAVFKLILLNYLVRFDETHLVKLIAAN